MDPTLALVPVPQVQVGPLATVHVAVASKDRSTLEWRRDDTAVVPTVVKPGLTDKEHKPTLKARLHLVRDDGTTPPEMSSRCVRVTATLRGPGVVRDGEGRFMRAPTTAALEVRVTTRRSTPGVFSLTLPLHQHGMRTGVVCLAASVAGMGPIGPAQGLTASVWVDNQVCWDDTWGTLRTISDDWMTVRSQETEERPPSTHSQARSLALHTGEGTELAFGVEVHCVGDYAAVTLGHDDLCDGTFLKYNYEGTNCSQPFFLAVHNAHVNNALCKPLRDLISGRAQGRSTAKIDHVKTHYFVLLFYIKGSNLEVTLGPTRDPRAHHQLGSWPGVLPEVVYLRTVARKAGSTFLLFNWNHRDERWRWKSNTGPRAAAP